MEITTSLPFLIILDQKDRAVQTPAMQGIYSVHSAWLKEALAVVTPC